MVYTKKVNQLHKVISNRNVNLSASRLLLIIIIIIISLSAGLLS